MRTCRELYPQSSEMYMCELESCPICGDPLNLSEYSSGHKTVQTTASVLEIGYWPKQCDNPRCFNYGVKWRSARWLLIAPLHCTYGFDVIATIGWQRRTERRPSDLGCRAGIPVGPLLPDCVPSPAAW